MEADSLPRYGDDGTADEVCGVQDRACVGRVSFAKSGTAISAVVWSWITASASMRSAMTPIPSIESDPSGSSSGWWVTGPYGRATLSPFGCRNSPQQPHAG